MKRYRYLIASLCMLLTVPASAAVFNVDSTFGGLDTNRGDGICATISGACTLQAAVQEANALPGADTINLPANSYNPNATLFINDELEIVGDGPNNTLVGNLQLVVNTALPVSVTGMTLQNGQGTQDNAFFLNLNVDLRLAFVRLANYGGPIIGSANSGINQLVIDNSLIEEGVSSFGGGLDLRTGNITISNSTIRNNTANFGGGIYLSSASLTLVNSTLQGNSSTAANNVNGGFGGGGILISDGATVIAINSTISGNTAVSNGAGVVIDDGSLSLYNSTVTDNRADSDNDLNGFGGGIVASSLSFSSNNLLQLSNSILAANVSALNNAVDCSSTNLTITSFGHNLVGAGTSTDCLIPPATGDQFGTVFAIDPMLWPLDDNGGPTQTHALMSGSPALDAANPAGCTDDQGALLTTDQRGVTRPLDSGSGAAICDIGAVEAQNILVRGPACDLQLNQSVFSDGDALTMNLFRFANPGASALPVEVKLWLQLPGISPAPVLRLGADGSFELGAGVDFDLGPTPLFLFNPAFPRGSYELNCRLLDPVTGELIAEDINPFELL